MLLNTQTRRGIEAGTITLVFRRWRRPTVKAGGSLLTPMGELEIVAVDPVEMDDIGPDDAAAAGFADVAELRKFLDIRQDGVIYRVTLGDLQPDPRIALRESEPSADEISMIVAKLRGYDDRSALGAWTEAALRTIADHPAVRAADLVRSFDMELLPFKANIRKLKALGLTESLEVGYRLSPRGRSVLRVLTGEAAEGNPDTQRQPRHGHPR